MKQVQLWMGHSDFSTTADIYAHLAPGALMESAGVLGCPAGGGTSGNDIGKLKKPKALPSAFFFERRE